jgi:hypothetical protein
MGKLTRPNQKSGHLGLTPAFIAIIGVANKCNFVFLGEEQPVPATVDNGKMNAVFVMDVVIRKAKRLTSPSGLFAKAK